MRKENFRPNTTKQHAKKYTTQPRPFYNKEEIKQLDKQQLLLTCERLDEDGFGIVTYQGKVIRIPYLLEKEEALIELHAHRTNLSGSIVEIKKTSPLRVKSKCQVFGTCGGCQLHHLRYEDQIAWKEQIVATMFQRLRNKIAVSPMMGCEDPLHYRHKNQMAFGLSKKKNIISGFYEENSHRVVNYDQCLIQHPAANAITATFKDLMKRYKLLPYEEETRTGLIRHLFIRTGYHTKEVLVIIVTSQDMFPARKGLLQDLRKAHPEITSIVQNVNSKDTAMVLGEKQRILFGSGFIQDQLCGITFQISGKSFYQVNPPQTELLYQKAIELAQIKEQDTVLDAYCGIGTIGLIAAKKARQIIGVEVNQDAVYDAMQNAKRNGIQNIAFYNHDASSFLEDLARRKEHIDVVLMDPPRSGSTPVFIKALGELQPDRIVYIACNVETQVRDIQSILPLGYGIKVIQPVDMFPYTKHIESIVLLERKRGGYR